MSLSSIGNFSIAKPAYAASAQQPAAVKFAGGSDEDTVEFTLPSARGGKKVSNEEIAAKLVEMRTAHPNARNHQVILATLPIQTGGK